MSARVIEGRLIDVRRGRARSGWTPFFPYLLLALVAFARRTTVPEDALSILTGSIVGLGVLVVPRLVWFASRGACAIHVRPGRVRIGRTILLRARDVIGASTARTTDGVAITIRSKWAQPMSVVVANDAAARDVLAALGVGHAGVGRLDWLLVPTIYRAMVGIFDSLLAASFVIAIALASWDPKTAAGILGAGFGWAIMTAIGRVQWRSMARRVVFDSWGVWLGHQQVPWSRIHAANEDPNGIVLDVDGRAELVAIPPGSMRPTEKAIVFDQIRAGIARARGLGPTKEEPHTRVDILGRGGAETRQWFTRIDALAASIGKPGYRHTSVEIADLWLTLEDPEAERDLRAAAARVLSRIAPEARVRIDAAIAATRDPRDEKRMRIAMEAEAEEAARDLDRFELP